MHAKKNFFRRMTFRPLPMAPVDSDYVVFVYRLAGTSAAFGAQIAPCGVAQKCCGIRRFPGLGCLRNHQYYAILWNKLITNIAWLFIIFCGPETG